MQAHGQSLSCPFEGPNGWSLNSESLCVFKFDGHVNSQQKILRSPPQTALKTRKYIRSIFGDDGNGDELPWFDFIT
jgi:hypothetical protein